MALDNRFKEENGETWELKRYPSLKLATLTHNANPMFGSNHLKSLKKQGAIITNSPFLSRMNPAERYEFLQLCHNRRYKAGDYIFYQGDPGRGMYFIEDGRIELRLDMDEENEEAPRYILNSSDSFGALSVLYEIRRGYHARCLTDCYILAFFRPDYETLRSRHPQIANKFLEAVTLTATHILQITSHKLEGVTNPNEVFSTQIEAYSSEELKQIIR